ncbi:unnamed protein product [Phytophthora fragariaefolia]|uniref:Unnamed protein product n=1 Tax=Phytophthora fragariaefolia TaxID=1490495 RepID=A0A9W7D0D3_9STRA|nr:unnamed protein product [Phytophthora fragariaefolia]
MTFVLNVVATYFVTSDLLHAVLPSKSKGEDISEVTFDGPDELFPSCAESKCIVATSEGAHGELQLNTLALVAIDLGEPPSQLDVLPAMAEIRRLDRFLELMLRRISARCLVPAVGSGEATAFHWQTVCVPKETADFARNTRLTVSESLEMLDFA